MVPRPRLGQAIDIATGAIAYDVFFDLLTVAQQTSYRTKIVAAAADLAAAANAGVWRTTDLVQNHNWVNFAALGLAGSFQDRLGWWGELGGKIDDLRRVAVVGERSSGRTCVLSQTASYRSFVAGASCHR